MIIAADRVKIRFKNLWRQFSPGDVAEFDYGVADALVKCLRAEFVNDDTACGSDAAPPSFADTGPENRMMQPEAIKRKRGRPRKAQ